MRLWPRNENLILESKVQKFTFPLAVCINFLRNVSRPLWLGVNPFARLSNSLMLYNMTLFSRNITFIHFDEKIILKSEKFSFRQILREINFCSRGSSNFACTLYAKSNKNLFVGWVRFITMHIGANLPTFPVNKFFPYYLCPRKWHVLLLFLATKRRVNRLFLPILSPLIFLKIPYFQPSRRHYKHDIKGLLLQDSFQRPLPQTTGCPKLIGQSVEISWFFCHSDFTWNQFWRI